MDWIIGGTKDSRDFINILSKDKNINLKNIILTTVSDYGKRLVEESGIITKSQAMNEEEMEEFILKNKIKRVFDLSHPYALEVSSNAMSVAEKTGINYFRFERENLNYKNSLDFVDIDEMIKFIEKLDGNILVTLGSNNIEKFKNLENLENIYFRILPVTDSIKKLENINIKAKNIIGIQGPFSKEFNIAIYKNYNIKYLITKESGITGGEKEKIEAAYETKVIPIVLKRPNIKYKWVTYDINEIIEKFKEGYKC